MATGIRCLLTGLCS